MTKTTGHMIRMANAGEPPGQSPRHSLPVFAVPPCPSRAAGDAPFPMCFTPGALAALLSTVGVRAPETGAKGFGPAEKMGFSIIEFDPRGSAAAGGAVYSPDVRWGEERCAFWLDRPDEEMRLWSGDIHSHPGGFGFPSGKAGQGLGDLGYAEEVFAANEAMQYFLLPILTGTAGPGPVRLWPWVVCRDDPHRPLWAEVKVCAAGEFPDRVFNPAWEASLKPSSAATPSSALDIFVSALAVVLTFLRLANKLAAWRPRPALPAVGAAAPDIPIEEETMTAEMIMYNFNPNAVCGEEDGQRVFIEDVLVDDRFFRIEYRCSPTGANATAWLRYSPWDHNTYSYPDSHLREDGFLCVGPHLDPDASPYGLVYVVKRARLWCTGYSFLMEHGYKETCRVMPDWRGN